MTQHTFGEIADEIPPKYHLPLGPNIWQLFKDNGWVFIKKDISLKKKKKAV